jgi:hypothetical protein
MGQRGRLRGVGKGGERRNFRRGRQQRRAREREMKGIALARLPHAQLTADSMPPWARHPQVSATSSTRPAASAKGRRAGMISSLGPGSLCPSFSARGEPCLCARAGQLGEGELKKGVYSCTRGGELQPLLLWDEADRGGVDGKAVKRNASARRRTTPAPSELLALDQEHVSTRHTHHLRPIKASASRSHTRHSSHNKRKHVTDQQNRLFNRGFREGRRAQQVAALPAPQPRGAGASGARA